MLAIRTEALLMKPASNLQLLCNALPVFSSCTVAVPESPQKPDKLGLQQDLEVAAFHVIKSTSLTHVPALGRPLLVWAEILHSFWVPTFSQAASCQSA